MVNQNFHTVVFQPIRNTPYNYFPQGNTIVDQKYSDSNFWKGE